MVKNLPANVGDPRDAGLIPGLGRSSEGGNGNTLQYSCLENPMVRGAWQATVHGVGHDSASEHSTQLTSCKTSLGEKSSLHSCGRTPDCNACQCLV